MRKDFWVEVDAHSPQGLALALIDCPHKTHPDRELPAVEFDETVVIVRSARDAWQQNNTICWSGRSSPRTVKVRAKENVVRNRFHL